MTKETAFIVAWCAGIVADDIPRTFVGTFIVVGLIWGSFWAFNAILAASARKSGESGEG